MGTPIVNRSRLVFELAYLLSQRDYNALMMRKNLDSEMVFEKKQKLAKLKDPSYKQQTFTAYVATSLAEEAVDAALGSVNKPNLVDPIEVSELSAVDKDICLYRMHDGGRGLDLGTEKRRTAGTLSGWWCNAELLLDIWNATSNLSGKARQKQVLEFLRSAMFIHPNWNHGTHVAVMRIPPGNSTAAIVGKGSWTAMQDTSDPARPVLKGEIRIRTQADVMDKLGMMPIPGPKQFYLPLFNDLWVTSVPSESASWPFQ